MQRAVACDSGIGVLVGPGGAALQCAVRCAARTEVNNGVAELSCGSSAQGCCGEGSAGQRIAKITIFPVINDQSEFVRQTSKTYHSPVRINS